MDGNQTKPRKKTLYSYPLIKPLGRVLRKAALLSKSQVRLALEEQENSSDLRIGEIFVMRGWLKKETVDFFAEEWPKIVELGADKPIGFYLKYAALLNDDQIEYILREQRKVKLKFGEIAVSKGWLKQMTLDFILAHIAPKEISFTDFVDKYSAISDTPAPLVIGEGNITYPDELIKVKIDTTAPTEQIIIPNLDDDEQTKIWTR